MSNDSTKDDRYDDLVVDSFRWLRQKVEDIEKNGKSTNDMVIELKTTVGTIQKIVYGAVGIALLSVAGAILALVLKK